jgi:hypothetical protein
MGAKSSKAKKHSRRRVLSWLKSPVQTSCGKAWAIIRPVLILHCPVYLKLLALCYGSARPLYPEQWFMRSRNHPQSLPSGGRLPQPVPPKLLSERELALCFTFQGKTENRLSHVVSGQRLAIKKVHVRVCAHLWYITAEEVLSGGRNVSPWHE